MLPISVKISVMATVLGLPMPTSTAWAERKCLHFSALDFQPTLTAIAFFVFLLYPSLFLQGEEGEVLRLLLKKSGEMLKICGWGVGLGIKLFRVGQDGGI